MATSLDGSSRMPLLTSEPASCSVDDDAGAGCPVKLLDEGSAPCQHRFLIDRSFFRGLLCVDRGRLLEENRAPDGGGTAGIVVGERHEQIAKAFHDGRVAKYVPRRALARPEGLA